MKADNYRILIVDDDESIAGLYREYLNDQYDTVVATSGQEALDKLDKTVDIVLLDRRMPELTGDKVAGRIREQPVDQKIVFITAVDPDFDLLHLEFDTYVVKPVTAAELNDVVDCMIDRIELEIRLRDLLRLASRLSALEHKLDIDELEQSDQYQQLAAEFNEKKKKLELSESDFYSEATLSKLRAVFENVRPA